MIQIKAFAAGAGESFYIYFPKDKFNIIIDGGFSYTYDIFKHTLKEIKDRGEILNLLIVTHMCRDHINGIIRLLKENGCSSERKIIDIKEIWFNTYFNSNRVKCRMKPPEDIAKLLDICFPENREDGYIGDIGAEELVELGNLILNGGYTINSHPIQIDTTPIISRGTITFKLLSPTKDSLENLENEFISKLPQNIKKLEDIYIYELSKYYERFASAQSDKNIPYIGDVSLPTLEELAYRKFEEDSMISNKSSLAFVLEYENKKLIFLGDSIPSIYMTNLKKYYPDLDSITFDLIKISHHGSKNNNSLEFFQKINSERFLISTNGDKYNHPDEETIARLILGHRNKTNIIINCKNENISRFIGKNEWIKKYNYSIEKRDYIEI